MTSISFAPGTGPSTPVILTIRPSNLNSEIFRQVFESRAAAQEKLDFWYGTTRFIDIKEWQRLSNILSEPPK